MGKNRLISKITYILFVLILAFMIINVAMLTRVDSGYAETINPKIDVESKTVHRGQAFTIDVELTKNSGFISLFITLSYDNSVMSLKNVEKGDALESLTFTTTNTQTDMGYGIIPFNMIWDGKNTDTKNGNLVRLTFESKSDAQIGNYPITITYDQDNTRSAYGVPQSMEIDCGEVTLIKGEYEAIYYDWDGTELYRNDFNADDVPAYVGQTPSRTEDECYSYTFNGWKGIVSDDLSVLKYQADYLLIPKTYQAFFYVDGLNESTFDGIVSVDDFYDAQEIEYGRYLGFDYPTKPRYVFSGWFIDAGCTQPFVDVYMPSHDISLYGFFTYDIRTTMIPKMQIKEVAGGSDNEAVFSATMLENTGLNAMVLTLSYDHSVMSFKGFTKGSVFSEMQFDTTNVEQGFDVDEFKFYYESTTNTTEVGEFLLLHFDIKQNAKAGVYDVTFSVGNTDATYINGANGIRYTKLDIVGAKYSLGKRYTWAEDAEDDAHIAIEDSEGMPADTFLKVSLVPKKVHNLSTEEVQKTAGQKAVIQGVYSLQLMRIIDGVETETQPNGTLTIQVNLTEEQKKCKNLTLYHLNDDGELIAYDCEVNGDVLQFKTDHLSMWAIVGEPEPETAKITGTVFMLIIMPILLAIVTIALLLIIIGKRRRERQKEINI
ncbi:MAG: hypothetical protein E7338_06320 [Clostridiales bacterium]|nr:hypothetical protein [Clostridiales bacterium]